MKKEFYFIICLWLLVSAFLIIPHEKILFFGDEVLLKTVPVDPRDILKGDYVKLSYEIGTLETQEQTFKEGATVYVVLEKDKNNIAHLKNVSDEKPKEGLFLKGKAERLRWHYQKGEKIVSKYGFKYGIENYFTNSKKARELEHNLAKGGLARIKVDKNGKARLIEVLPDIN